MGGGDRRSREKWLKTELPTSNGVRSIDVCIVQVRCMRNIKEGEKTN